MTDAKIDFAVTSSATVEEIRASTTAQATPVKVPSGEQAAADDSSSPSTSESTARASSATARNRPGSATRTPRPSGKGHRPHSGAGDASPTHKLPHPTIIPSFPSPENPPNHPLPPPHPQSPPPHNRPRKHGVPAAAIAFAVIGGLVAAFLIYMGARCCYSYKRVRRPDRIDEVVSRHYLDEEMRERQREDMERRWILFRSSAASPTRFVPPPPPYIHAPAYEQVTTSDPPSPPPSTPPPPAIQHV